MLIDDNRLGRPELLANTFQETAMFQRNSMHIHKSLPTICVLCFLIITCSHQDGTNSDYIISSDEKSDITALAQSLRNLPVDSVLVRNVHPSPYFVGVAYYQPEIIDSDKVVYSKL
jgi:hypothetical protein